MERIKVIELLAAFVKDNKFTGADLIVVAECAVREVSASLPKGTLGLSVRRRQKVRTVIDQIQSLVDLV